MSDGPRYSIIPGGAVRDRRLKGYDLRVLCDLGTHTNREGWCHVSQNKMAAAFGCANSTISRSLDRLVAYGYVERFALNGGELGDGKARKATGKIQRYRVKIDREETADLCTSAKVRDGRPLHLGSKGPLHLGSKPITTFLNDQKGQSTIWIDADDPRWRATAARWCAQHGRRSVPRDKRNGWTFPATMVEAP